MTLSNVQSAVIAAVSQIVGVIVAFGIIDSNSAGIVITASISVVNAAFLVASAIHAHSAAIVKAAYIGR